MPAPEQPFTVLIVDDDPGVTRLVERALRREGYDTATAGSGKEATAWLLQHRADLLLLDLHLPDTDGREFIQSMAEAGNTVPFIIITGQGDERVAVDLMKRGALDYLGKDVNFIEFVPTVVRRGMEQLERGRQLEEAEKNKRASEARYRHLVEALPTAVYTCDAEGCITLFNKAAVALWGREPVIGENCWDGSHLIFDPAGAPVPYAQSPMARGIHDGRAIRDVEVIIERPDGARIHALAFSDPSRDTSGDVVGAVNMFVDITERKELEREVLEISAHEQRRFGQDLHDDLGQWLAGTAYLATALANTLARESPAHVAAAQRIAETLRQTQEHARIMAHGLVPALAGSAGLADALRALASNVESLFRIRCSYEGPETVSVRDEVAALHLYHIAQEACSNAVRHGRAKEVCIVLRTDEGQVTMLIRDDGSGLLQPLPQTPGLGLRTMRYRAGIVGARLEIRPGASGGTEVTCTWKETLGANGGISKVCKRE